MIGDHSTGGAIIGGSLRAAGFTGIIRYSCGGRGDVNITPDEVRDIRVNGLKLGLVLEHEADWLLRPALVAERVNASVAISRACGVPDGVLYLAADFDATNGGPTSPGSPGDQNMTTILRSFNIAAGIIGQANVGWYGSKFGIDWLAAHAPWVKWFWQTEAWSMGQVHPRAQIFQRAQSTTVAGVDVDLDPVLLPAWGWRGETPAPPPDPYHYLWFPNDLWHSPHGDLRERDIVLHYDGARKWWKRYGRYLHQLRVKCDYLSRRLEWEAHMNNNNWQSFHRAWRHDQLRRRAHGDRIA